MAPTVSFFITWVVKTSKDCLYSDAYVHTSVGMNYSTFSICTFLTLLSLFDLLTYIQFETLDIHRGQYFETFILKMNLNS